MNNYQDVDVHFIGCCLSTCVGVLLVSRQGGRGEGEGGREGAAEDKFRDCVLPTVTCPACAKVVAVAGATVSNPLLPLNWPSVGAARRDRVACVLVSHSMPN